MIPFIADLGKRAEYVIDSPTYSRTRRLDIWRSENADADAPVMMFIPGGGWTVSKRQGQAHALMARLCDRGWICTVPEYRTAPIHRWPAPYDDVIAAWEWTVDNIHKYGGGDFISISGASAGGHMASLLSLSDLGIPRPDATVSMYAPYSWDSRRLDHRLINEYVERVVVQRSRKDGADYYYYASPIHLVDNAVDIPPWLVVHGTSDFVTPCSGAKAFFNKLDKASRSNVEMLTIPGGQHAFDLINQRQADSAIEGIVEHLEAERAELEAAS